MVENVGSWTSSQNGIGKLVKVYFVVEGMWEESEVVAAYFDKAKAEAEAERRSKLNAGSVGYSSGCGEIEVE